MNVDQFKERDPSPKYVPRRSGVDAETQVWDNDLFVFEREVRPILDVLADKTLEQSLLELEEECELQNMADWREEQKRIRRDRNQELQAQIKQEKKRET